ncbi:hypothetical protein LMG22037_03537 [Paraburkholderia phenoliruptrix]|uniref:Uncharacterized protein n=1 Tax=Paraburkholderia phenoliruptrix TaxID=252970 RepID=A0A6J5BDM5_9BURK|nr:hypothetical protein [Paraburkholderia phenoliruptrix]CAB3701522.1 hypothetical protein LMG22037_03537 [Paraburkholderia phenoliruptrix]
MIDYDELAARGRGRMQGDADPQLTGTAGFTLDAACEIQRAAHALAHGVHVQCLVNGLSVTEFTTYRPS